MAEEAYGQNTCHEIGSHNHYRRRCGMVKPLFREYLHVEQENSTSETSDTSTPEELRSPENLRSPSDQSQSLRLIGSRQERQEP